MVKMNAQEVQYWDEYKGELTQPQINKARKFIPLIEYLGDNRFACNPIIGYNSTVHLITSDPEFNFRCSCQGFRDKEKKLRSGLTMIRPFCSHLHALFLCFRQKKFDRWWLRIKEEEYERE